MELCHIFTNTYKYRIIITHFVIPNKGRARHLFEDKKIFALRPFYLMCAHYIPIHFFGAFFIESSHNTLATLEAPVTP